MDDLLYSSSPLTIARPCAAPGHGLVPMLVAVLAVGSASAAWGRAITPRGELGAEERANIELFRQASGSVVYITNLAVRRDLFSFNVMEVPQGTGSGFIWDAAGHVVTNFHVIQSAEAAEVTLADRSTWPAELIGVDRDKDIAVLKIAPGAKVTLRPLAVGSSHDLLVGQKVYAIGNPFGLDQTLTTGIISALGREIQSVTRRPIQGVIQTDAVINPGNSGGPLLDSDGRLIGMNTAIYSPTGASVGIGFAVPVDSVNRIVEELIKYGKAIRPVLGLRFAEDQLARNLGVPGLLVLEVVPGSGGERAGLRPTRRDRHGRVQLGDIVLAADGKPVKINNDLYRLLDARAAGDKVKLTVLRDDRKIEVVVVLSAER